MCAVLIPFLRMEARPSSHRTLQHLTAQAAADPSAPRSKRPPAPVRVPDFTAGSDLSAAEEQSPLSISSQPGPRKKPAPSNSVASKDSAQGEEIEEEQQAEEGTQTEGVASSLKKGKGGPKTSPWHLCFDAKTDGTVTCAWLPDTSTNTGTATHESIFTLIRSNNLSRHMQRWQRVFSAVEKTVETGQSVPTLLQKLRELQSTDAKFTQSTLALKKAQERRPGQLEKEVALVMWLAAQRPPRSMRLSTPLSTRC